MNKIKYLYLLIVILLAACGANATPTPATNTPAPTNRTFPTNTPAPTLTVAPVTKTPALAATSESQPTVAPAAKATNAPLPTAAPVATIAPEQATTAPVSSGTVQVHIINVGQGDAILVRAPDGSYSLIDGGEAGSGAVAYLKSQGVTRLSLVVATHPHSDHIGGLPEVLKAFKVDRVVTNGESHTTLAYEHFLDAIAAAKAEFVEVKRGDTLSLGGLTLNVLSSGGVSNDDMNQNSVVLRMVFGKTTFLFMGDAGKVVESTLLASGVDVSADILKVGHHGSNTASSPAFLSQVKPKVAVYSAGIGNSYGHPHAETIAALTAIGAQIYGTDQNGTVVITADGSGYSINTAKQGNAQAPPAVDTAAQATTIPAAQPTAAPVAQSTAVPVAQPTTAAPQPTQASAAALSIAVTSLTSPIAKGGNATLSIKTVAGANCGITVYYKSGASKAAGLDPKSADGNGNVSWTWKVGTGTTPGTWRIVVNASANGQNASQEIPFVVQ